MRRVPLLLTVLVAGCGGGRAATPTTGAPVPDRAAAALECDGPVYHRGAGDYDSGLQRVQGLPETALVDWIANEAPQVPENGYRVEARGNGRALLSYDVDGRTKVAVVAANGLRDYEGGTGWGVETWAQCDPSELPDAFTGDRGIGVWEDAAGRRIPVKRVQSFAGAEHCGWQEVTFLTVGDRWYVRDTTGGELAPLLRTTF